ncbi:MAG: hypothetical protein WCF03_16815 [Nitrososphaeraceae archaeon]
MSLVLTVAVSPDAAITAFEINYQALGAVFPAASTTDDIGCFIRKPVEMDDLVKKQMRRHIRYVFIRISSYSPTRSKYLPYF